MTVKLWISNKYLTPKWIIFIFHFKFLHPIPYNDNMKKFTLNFFANLIKINKKHTICTDVFSLCSPLCKRTVCKVGETLILRNTEHDTWNCLFLNNLLSA